uniref:TNF receptor-associated factor 2 n=1 Tax=Knipowitschia caucasica TaxID=637954 RepID=A0AAV2ISD9_KNICA
MVVMSDQPDRSVAPTLAPEPLPKDSRGIRGPTCEGESEGQRRQRRRQTAESPVSVANTKTSPGTRLKPVEPLFPVFTADNYDTKFDRKKPSQISKTNAQYHKLFKELIKDEILKQSYTCALQRDILYQGKMFVSENWICFHSKVFGRDTKIAIPVTSVTFIKKTKTALLVPNALVIETTHEQHVFVSFLSRNTTFKLLKSLCSHLEVDKACSSPVVSSCENSFRVRCPSPLPLDFSADLCDLDGVVQQRRHDIMESSSTGSQTPDSDKMTEFAALQNSFLTAVKSSEVSARADVHLPSPSQNHTATLKNGPIKTFRPIPHDNSRLSRAVSFHAILFICLFLVSVLVLSSCYMAFKIVALEHRLNSLLSRGEQFPHHKPQDDVNAGVYGELSTNLLKLEKIQRNLQKLLDETLNADRMATQEPSPPSSMESNKPGFPKKILGNQLEDKHLCNCCHNILRRPVQAQCGHRFCSYCFNRTVNNGPQKCNACIKEDLFEETTSILKQGCAFPDNAVRREVESLSAVCVNDSCTWKGSIKDYELTHEGKCEYMVIPCPSCKERIRFNEQERHNERECPERTLNCKYCKEPFHFKNIKAHDEICPKYPMICEGCAKKKIPREKYVDHIKFCSKFRTPCRFHVVGCDMSVEKEKIHDHERAYAYEHLNLLLHYIMGMKVSMEGIQPQGLELAGHKLVELQQSLKELEARVSQLSTATVPPVQGATASSSSSTSAALPPPTLAPTLSVSTSFTPLPSSVGAALELQLHNEKTKVAELGRRCTELEVKSGTFENVVCVLNREVERFATTLEASNRQHKLDQDKIEALTNKVRQLERTVGLKDLTVAEMEGRLREMSATTFDGVFIWRISDFAKKRQDAIAGRAPAMFSPAFYTSKYGYKMCLRIYLNGDGTGRGSHLSLFFVVMRGLSDALLKWPFNQKVTLMLLDQSNREHIIDAFRPDVTSSSFQRPVSEMNIASGCPLFCPLSKLDAKNSYIRDDTIFIKAIVDLTGL